MKEQDDSLFYLLKRAADRVRDVRRQSARKHADISIRADKADARVRRFSAVPALVDDYTTRDF